jgi:hypothetical protein
LHVGSQANQIYLQSFRLQWLFELQDAAVQKSLSNNSCAFTAPYYGIGFDCIAILQDQSIFQAVAPITVFAPATFF